jgi:hypothetical protein
MPPSKNYLLSLVLANPLLRSGDVDRNPRERQRDYEWLSEAVTALRDKGVELQRVTSIDNATNEDKRPEQPSVTWEGYGIDGRSNRVPFRLVWHIDAAKFGKEPHYYVLDVVEVKL